jgi:hypothetical protein
MKDSDGKQEKANKGGFFHSQTFIVSARGHYLQLMSHLQKASQF